MFAVMKLPKIIIAIDGHSSTGKSTFAKLIAKELGLIYVDTGALYRGVTLFALREGLIDNGVVDELELKRKLNELKIEFKYTPNLENCGLYINKEFAERQIRSLEVSSNVSLIAKIGFVREFVDDILHELGRQKGVIMDGRDIGTVVFPDAELKIFMTAKPEVRAQRRFDEMKAAGENPDYAKILENITGRDNIDSSRDIAPLKIAPDAILLDNSNMTISQQLEWLIQIIEKRWNLKLR